MDGFECDGGCQSAIANLDFLARYSVDPADGPATIFELEGEEGFHIAVVSQAHVVADHNAHGKD